MGRNLTLRLPEDLVRRAREVALKRGQSLNAFVEELLRQALAEEGPEESLACQLSWMRQRLFSSEGQALPSREERHARGA
ncbi:DUF6364 family protein [Thermus sp.]|jgi:plasmid stability protein|uniref:DUF6364 family protein n=1 Tax=Thermus sp. TaxID=275 RepID=UPI0028CBD458|nr:DUF6364 family protein [Thermus sp.]MDT7909416.1 DUF6364 family protein [Thermus sp.]MDT7922143.1 DUF6364 family protein [Thermus sp.]